MYNVCNKLQRVLHFRVKIVMGYRFPPAPPLVPLAVDLDCWVTPEAHLLAESWLWRTLHLSGLCIHRE